MRNSTLAILMLTIVLLSGCASVKSESELLKKAQSDYGPATVVSSDEYKDDRVLLLQDNEYGFEYEIRSTVSDILIDGSKFGSSESTSSDFAEKYIQYIENSEKNAFSQIEKTYNAKIISGEPYQVGIAAEILFDNNAVDYKKATTMLADIFNKYDTRGFLKDYLIYADQKDGTHLGSVKVADNDWSSFEASENVWRSPEDEKVEYYTWHAQNKNKNAVYLRTEQKPFSYAGIPLSRVAHILGSEYPDSMDYPVNYYFFEADGKEFYVADFVDEETMSMYTNYK